jgi:hypothetical protein
MIDWSFKRFGFLRSFYTVENNLFLIFRTEEFLLLSLCHGLSYALPSTIASNLFYSKTTIPTNFIFCTHVAWVSAYKFCAQQLHQMHTGHTACQKSNSFKDLLQKQKCCRETEYSFG